MPVDNPSQAPYDDGPFQKIDFDAFIFGSNDRFDLCEPGLPHTHAKTDLKKKTKKKTSRQTEGDIINEGREDTIMPIQRNNTR